MFNNRKEEIITEKVVSMAVEKMEVLLTAKQIEERIKELAEAISEDYRGTKILVIGVLKGAVIFLSDLVRHLSIPVEIDFMAVSSYGADTNSSGVVRILKDLEQSITDKEVLIVEDIIDTGLTLAYLYEIPAQTWSEIT
jgi:hypoxanthine phosphoribosyltransferase